MELSARHCHASRLGTQLSVRHFTAHERPRKHLLGLVLSRTHHDFTVTDRETAAALQPILGLIARQHALMARHPRSGEVPAGGLTQRELVVLDLLTTGHTAATTGLLLGISPRTAQKHLERIYRKLAVSDRHLAIVAARSHHIV